MTHPFRIPLLQLTGLSIILTIGKLLVDPVAGQRPFAPMTFPTTVSIAGWQPVDRQPLGDRRSDAMRYNQIVAGQRYRFQSANNHLNRELTMEVRYVVNTSGNILQLMQEQAIRDSPTDKIPQSSSTQVSTDLGIYSRLKIDKKTHLTSCINPDGGSTVTADQFLHSRYSSIQLDHLLSWALGRNDLLDKRCLWIDLAMSADGQPSDRIAADLEAIWRDQVMDWRSHFPRP